MSENVMCKFVRIKKGINSNYYDPVFYHQELYCANVKHNSLTVFRPDNAAPTIVLSG